MKLLQSNLILPAREFHVSRVAREKYLFDDQFFSTKGESILANFNAIRLFTQVFNEKRALGNESDQVIHSSELNAMGLVHEILHYVFSLYREQKNPFVVKTAMAWLNERLTAAELDSVLLQFAREFPTTDVHHRKIRTADYLEGYTDGFSNREIILEEILMLWLENNNPAFSPFKELFDDSNLLTDSKYSAVVKELHSFFDTQPFFGPDEQNLMDMLRNPAIEAPDSLQGQLDYIRDRWDYLIGDYLQRLLKSLDFLSEEFKLRDPGPGETKILKYDYIGEDESERFSPDRNWMPGVVMIAKNIFVWLNQLSQSYGRSITQLDEIPDEELDRLANYGFTALWLIGLWERSRSSKEIKQIRGSSEAEASAYSLLDYSIAHVLGGQDAFENLKNRCWYRGIHMASDMVPNHTGIDSKWVIEHPDWFISLDHSPFPSYSFNGKNLSHNERVGIFLEDHYYNRSDAAVVFKRCDFWTGDEKYIYHGNDGTAMPWNDTAQLNYLNPDVREAVIQTILHVARNFPIIRFDAAMTLTRKHFQRLWFPIPGTGSDIASRAEYGLSKPEFDAQMPEEFWREVVDRVAAEAPDTLLLAEAFWMMEGYFVRTLGMHRVYNSAFMNMLKMEENKKYRTTVKNTLEFDPEILKRFVNFLSNPDEETAVKQFGKGDKYFGVTLMMVTMPGLPLFGHGQIEGFEEKYGMEYNRGYWDESPDADLIQRHKHDIFPVLKKRYLFSEVKNFLLYDFYTAKGIVNENVFAYSNQVGKERALIFYNNAYESTSGWIKSSAAYNDKGTVAGNPNLRQKNLGQGLKLTNLDNYYLIFREHVSGLEYIRKSNTVFDQGLFVKLNGYQYQLFWDLKEVMDNKYHHYQELHNALSGEGVPSIDSALIELHLKPVHNAFNSLAGRQAFEKIYSGFKQSAPVDFANLSQFEKRWRLFSKEVLHFAAGGEDIDINSVAERTRNQLENTLLLRSFKERFKAPRKRYYAQSAAYLNKGLKEYDVASAILLLWVILDKLGDLVKLSGTSRTDLKMIEDLQLSDQIEQVLINLGFDNEETGRGVQLLRLLCKHRNLLLNPDPKQIRQSLKSLLNDKAVHHYLGVNLYDGILWFRKEAFEEILWSIFAASVIIITAVNAPQPSKVSAEIINAFRLVKNYLTASDLSRYKLHKMKALLL